MKRFLTPILAAALTLSAAALVAQQDNRRPNSARDESPQTYDSARSAGTYEGTVSQIDSSGSSFVLRDRSGSEVTISWDQSTRLTGVEASQGTGLSALKVGDEVVVKTSAQGGKNVASMVQVRPKKSS
ncbi:MAG TPA: DUF5666 domain-containing protein [Thermoanaerobaculia bacterium]|nr:DUF5666 domain-containing protein [Thermoanaerobaculia bacterium]